MDMSKDKFEDTPVDTGSLNVYFPTTLVNNKAAANQRRREQQAMDVDSDSDISSSDEYDSDLELYSKNKSSSHSNPLALWAGGRRNKSDEEFDLNFDNDDDDDDDDDVGAKTSRFTQLTLRKRGGGGGDMDQDAETEMMLHRKKRRSKKKRQRMTRLLARKELLGQSRQRSREMFDEYGSTFVYALISMGITFLVLYFIGYSDEVQPIVSAQLWLVFGIGAVVFLLFVAEAFFATRPLFVRINSAINGISSTTPSTTPAASGGGEEEKVQGSFLSHSISSTSIDIPNTPHDNHRPISHGGEGQSSQSTSHHLAKEEEAGGNNESLFRSPMVPRRDNLGTGGHLNRGDDEELTAEELRNFGIGQGKLSPMSALEAN